MEVGDLLHRLARRARLVALVVVLAVVAAAVSWLRAGTEQRSGAAVVIVPPTLGTAVSDQNPLLNLNDNLSQLATVLSGAMNSASATRDLRSRNATDPFTVSTVTGDNPSFARLTPELVFTATGPSGTSVRRTATALVAVARTQLAALQDDADVPSDARAVLVQAVEPTAPEDVGGGRLRAAGSIGLAVLVIGLVLVLAWDELRRRRWERRHGPRRLPRGPRRARRAAGELVSIEDPDAAPGFRSR